MQFSPNRFNTNTFDSKARLYVAYDTGLNPSGGIFDKVTKQQIGYYPTYTDGSEAIRTSPIGRVFVEEQGNNSIRVFNRYNYQTAEFNVSRSNWTATYSRIWTIEGDNTIYYANSTGLVKHVLGTGDIWTWTRPVGFTIWTVEISVTGQIWVGGQSINGVDNLYRVDSAGVTAISYEVEPGPNNTIVSMSFCTNGDRYLLVRPNTTNARLYEANGAPSMILDIYGTYGAAPVNISSAFFTAGSKSLVYFAMNGKGYVYDIAGALNFSSTDATVFAGSPFVKADSRDSTGGTFVYVYNTVNNRIDKRNNGFGNTATTYIPTGSMVDTLLQNVCPLAPTFYPA